MYIYFMDNIQKFFSDVQKIKKHYRSENPVYDGKKVCIQIQNLFSNSNRNLKSLADAFSDYWMNKYILNSNQPENEPTEEHIKILGAMQALIENDIFSTEALSKDDWKELCQITNCEAEEIPIETLNSMMMIFLDKQAM